MEGSEGIHGFPGPPRNISDRLSDVAPEGNLAAGNNGDGGGNNNGTSRVQECFVPIANVVRIMRKVLPTHAKITDEAKETMQECISEYISFITSEANERCRREQRKTVTAEDVLWAMTKLGFDDYIEPLRIYLHRYRELEGERRAPIQGQLLPINCAPPPLDDLAAAALYGPLMPPPSIQVPSPSPPPPTLPIPLAHPHLGDYGEGMGGYYRGMYESNGDGNGASSSQLPMPSFDPYAPYN